MMATDQCLDPIVKMEFSVKLTCNSCADKVRSKLANVPGIYNMFINIAEDLVLVDSVLTTSEVHSLLESTGLLVFFKGFGAEGFNHHGDISEQTAAVAILKTNGEQIGLVRLVQTQHSRCVVEATVDKLPVGTYCINIHQYGDLSEGVDSCGEPYCVSDEVPPAGFLGKLIVDETGTSTLRIVSHQLRVSDVIGRSMIVSSNDKRLMCGVIARSAGLFQNPKKICTCDGVTIWDEATRQLR